MQNGPVAQLGERLHGMQEVVGSIPIGSTGINPLKHRVNQAFTTVLMRECAAKSPEQIKYSIGFAPNDREPRT